MVNNVTLKQLLQDVDVHIVTTNHNSQHLIDAELVTIPAEIPNLINIAVQPSAGYFDLYWLACVENKKTTQPLVYNLQYYQYNKTKKGWNLMCGNQAYGTTPHNAILLVGIEFNNNISLKADHVKLLQYIC